MSTETRRNRNNPSSVDNEKAECVNAIVFLVSRYHELSNTSKVSPNVESDFDNAKVLIKDLIDRTLWAFSEVRGKYSKKQIWSQSALKAYEESQIDEICLEHPFERARMKSKLVSNPEFVGQNAKEAIRTFLDRFCLGVVITREEHRALNRLERNLGFNDATVWREFYRQAGIELVDPTE